MYSSFVVKFGALFFRTIKQIVDRPRLPPYIIIIYSCFSVFSLVFRIPASQQSTPVLPVLFLIGEIIVVLLKQEWKRLAFVTEL